MLPFRAASGHSLYAKFARVYLQSMADLEKRSSRTWAGLSPDLMIQQVLMRSMKTCGGLTRGRGMTEQHRLTWLLSMPVCAEVNRAMQEFTGVKHNTGEQNKDLSKERQVCDMKDMNTLLMAA